MSLDNLFDRIYCINLDRRTDRWESVQNEFKKFNIKNIIRFSGIDGNMLKNDTVLLNGELGILLTHLEIIKKAKLDNLDNVLIIEDDVIFSDEFLNIQSYMKEVPDDWDFIYFGGNHIYGKPPQKINEKILKLNFTVALQCVAIKKTMFDKIIEILPKKQKQVDGYYADFHKSCNAYCFYPNIAKQKEGFSDIQNKFVNYSIFFK
jgi:GR25 family glycosyltransferase involved in LPS biosynthesis